MKTVLALAEKLKPFLVRIMPISLLRKIKKNMIVKEMKKLETRSPLLPFQRDGGLDGVNLIGYIQGEIGLGQSCRLVAETLLASEIPFTIYNYHQVSAIRMGDHSWDGKITNATPYNINLIHINPYELPLAYSRIGRQTWDGRYNIAFWLWELEKFPKEWIPALNLADEIWTPSEYASASIREVTSKPVLTMPYALENLEYGDYSREDFYLPNHMILFLCMYDTSSTMERKNPIGVIKAFKKAFSRENNDIGLVIKVNNPRQCDIEKIKHETAGYSNIFLLTEVHTKAQVNALISCVDVYVSLHRAEGFGLVPAEAMLLGTPVVATNWSANTEFMNQETACLVDYTFVSIDKTFGPYQPGNRWAEPNLDSAAGHMRNLALDENLRNEMSQNAKRYIQEHFNARTAGERLKQRLNEVYIINERHISHT